MGVYSKVSRCEVKTKRRRVVFARWVDTNKGDDKSPNCRSRLVGREVRIESRLDLFAPTPPLEAMKLPMSMCARGQHRSQNRRLRMMTIDVSRAYFYAPAEREVYIEILVEDREAGDEGMGGKLNLSVCTERATRRSIGPRSTLELLKRSGLSKAGHRHATSGMCRET